MERALTKHLPEGALPIGWAAVIQYLDADGQTMTMSLWDIDDMNPATALGIIETLKLDIAAIHRRVNFLGHHSGHRPGEPCTPECHG